MKRLVSAIIPAVVFFSYLYLLRIPVKTSGGTLPPVGHFFNPFSGFWQNAESFTLQDETLRLSGLNEPVSVVFDERLVPHIFARNEEDLTYVQGYLHARFRLWQMDITARQSAGRLSEVFGRNLLANDQRMRRMGMARTAEYYVESWQECDEYPMLENYVRGVNAFITQLDRAEYPVEFKLFNYQPELWTMEKTAMVVMSMNLTLCGRNEDLMATNTLNLLGKEQFETLFPRWNPRQSPVIPAEVCWDFQAAGQSDANNSTGYFEGEIINDAPRFIGSNNWAVSGEKTEDGIPVLCNDPHLSLTLPSIWYELQMQSDRQNTYGVSIPGIPYIAIGFNDYIAWGETNVGMDVSDLYEIKWLDDAQTTYLLDGKAKAVETRIEQYLIKDGGIEYDTVKITHWGPVLPEGDRSVALHWLPNLIPDNCLIITFRRLNQARNFTDYYQALQPFQSPAQNFVFASKEGDIALKVQGAFPIKPENEGQFIMDGSTRDNAWKDYILFEQTPFVKNPDRGFVSSANQHSTDTTYPYRYHGYFEDYRGRTLNEELEKMEGISIEQMQALQNSNYDKLAAELCPLLITLVHKQDAGNAWTRELESWDFRYEAGSRQPVLFEIWKENYYHLVWDEIRQVETERNLKMLYPEMWRTIALTEEDPANRYFDRMDTPEREEAADLALSSLQISIPVFDSLFQLDPELTWKTYRPVAINHLSRIGAFSAKRVETGGTANALNSVKETHGPSWRMIVKLSDPVQAWGVYPGGQSGNPGSQFYQDQVETWAQGQYYPLHHVRRVDDLTKVMTLNLLPK
jgi:penicillin G amidase